MSPVPAVVSTDPNIVPVAPVTRTAPATTAAACDAEPTICAYASPPRSVAALADEEEEKEDPFPLRTYCGCKSEIHTDDDKDKGYGDWWRTFLKMKKKKPTPTPKKGSAPGAPVTPVVSTDPATTDATIASVMSPVPADNIPRGAKRDRFAEIYDCAVGPSDESGDRPAIDEGVHILSTQYKGTMFPLFGDFKRRTTAEQPNQITSVILRPVPGETKPFYLRVSDECPWKFVRDPVQVAEQIKADDLEADVTGITANCAVMEQSCSMDQLNKVVLVLLEDVIIKEGEPPVELLCTYNITKLRNG
jgi:hypothetical protein